MKHLSFKTASLAFAIVAAAAGLMTTASLAAAPIPPNEANGMSEAGFRSACAAAGGHIRVIDYGEGRREIACFKNGKVTFCDVSSGTTRNCESPSRIPKKFRGARNDNGNGGNSINPDGRPASADNGGNDNGGPVNPDNGRPDAAGGAGAGAGSATGNTGNGGIN